MKTFKEHLNESEQKSSIHSLGWDRADNFTGLKIKHSEVVAFEWGIVRNNGL